MKKLLLNFAIISAAVLAFPPLVTARQLTVDEAVKNAPARFSGLATRASAEVAYTQKVADLNVAYVMNDPAGRGYVVLSADDVMPAVLGYADSGTIDPDNMPPALTDWLGNYGRLLEYAVAHGLGVRGDTDGDFSPLDPLCTTQWNQDSPYNDLCPDFDGGRAPTGCTATAMSQAVNYHKWPAKGSGVHTYEIEIDKKKKELTWDFGDTTFEWDLMIDNYGGGKGNEEQRNAVAVLMAAVGNASCMGYGKNSSGAWTYNALYGVVNYMNFDKSALHLSRNYFGHDEWVEMIYREIEAKRPVVYSGYNDGGGHAFIIDGYSQNGFFHLNWGWGGSSDGYFLLTGLDPASQGIGGSAAGYNAGQDACFNLMPAREDTQFTARLLGEGTLMTEKTTTKRNERIQFKSNGGAFYYSCINDMKVTLGVVVAPAGGGEAKFIEGTSFDFKSHYGTPSMNSIASISVKASELPSSGEYEARPAFKYNDEVFTIHYRVGQSDYITLVCDDEKIVSKRTTPERKMTVENLKINDLFYAGNKASFSATVTNSGAEYLGYLKLRANNEKGYVAGSMNGNGPWVDLVDGQSMDVEFTADFISGGDPLKPGKYSVLVVDDSGKALEGEPLEIEILEVPTGELKFSGSWVAKGAFKGTGTSSDPYIVGDEFDVELTIDVTSGLFTDKVNFWGNYDGHEGWLPISCSTVEFKVGKGYSQTLTSHLNVSEVPENIKFKMDPYGWHTVDGQNDLGWTVTNNVGGGKYFKRDPSAGVGDVESEQKGIYPNPASDYTTVVSADEIRNVKIYSIAGTLVLNVNGDGGSSLDVEVSSLSAGHYVVVVETASGTERHKLIKR